jgi:hypothetical protein
MKLVTNNSKPAAFSPAFKYREAKANLTRLGIGLYSFYLVLTLGGFCGVALGLVSILLKCIHKGLAVNTSWLEVILLTVGSLMMMRFFLQESGALLQPDKAPANQDKDLEGPVSGESATIIPFKRTTHR